MQTLNFHLYLDTLKNSPRTYKRECFFAQRTYKYKATWFPDIISEVDVQKIANYTITTIAHDLK